MALVQRVQMRPVGVNEQHYLPSMTEVAAELKPAAGQQQAHLGLNRRSLTARGSVVLVVLENLGGLVKEAYNRDRKTVVVWMMKALSQCQVWLRVVLAG